MTNAPALVVGLDVPALVVRLDVGACVGLDVGTFVGFIVRLDVGTSVGLDVGTPVRVIVGLYVGAQPSLAQDNFELNPHPLSQHIPLVNSVEVHRRIPACEQ